MPAKIWHIEPEREACMKQVLPFFDLVRLVIYKYGHHYFLHRPVRPVISLTLFRKEGITLPFLKGGEEGLMIKKVFLIKTFIAIIHVSMGIVSPGYVVRSLP
jgi:hypothetical protein